MKLAVIAAQGRSGRAFVQEALAAGHEVRAGIRGQDLFEPNPKLSTMQCDATDKAQVTNLIENCDAVVSLIGHVKGSDDFVQTKATEAIVTAMEVTSVKRLISLTGTGVWVPGDKNEAFIKLLNTISAKFGVKRFDDGIAHIKVLEASNLEWTVIRVLMLTDGQPGTFNLRSHGKAKVPTSRREVARAILQILEKTSFIHECPVVTKK